MCGFQDRCSSRTTPRQTVSLTCSILCSFMHICIGKYLFCLGLNNIKFVFFSWLLPSLRVDFLFSQGLLEILRDWLTPCSPVKYLLTVIDVLSKYAWAVPIKSKSSQGMIRGLEVIRRQASPRQSLRVQTDQGKEFYNRGVQAWFKKHGWHRFSTYGDSKASVVERWHRTLKQRMYRYFTAHSTLRYVDVLQPLIHTYNHAYHQSIGMAPHQVTPKTVPEI